MEENPSTRNESKLARFLRLVKHFLTGNPSPQYARNPVAKWSRWSCYRALTERGGVRAGMVCGAKRIRSLYLPWMIEVTPRLSTTTPPRGLASFSTINGATMRLCRLVPNPFGGRPPCLSRA
jgi:hypothetical protein